MLTRDANETIRARAARDPEFRQALAEEAGLMDLLEDISAGRNAGELPDDLIAILRQVRDEVDVDLDDQIEGGVCL